jgi:hypothetical protein
MHSHDIDPNKDYFTKLDQAIAEKKRQERIDALRLSIPEPEVQNFRNLYFTHAGHRLTLTQWAKRIGITYSTLVYRYKQGKRGEALFSMNPYVKMPNTPSLPPEYVKNEKTKRIRTKIKTDKYGTPIVEYDTMKAQAPDKPTTDK